MVDYKKLFGRWGQPQEVGSAVAFGVRRRELHQRQHAFDRRRLDCDRRSTDRVDAGRVRILRRARCGFFTRCANEKKPGCPGFSDL